MSRIGRRPIELPKGVEFNATEDGLITVKGPKGTLTRNLSPELIYKLDGVTLTVDRPTDEKNHRALHGLTRTLIANMVEGVSTGYTRQLEIVGVGFRATMTGQTLTLNVGFSHAIEVWPREGVAFSVANDPQTRNPVVTIEGIDKERIGQTAAEIRKMRKPEPYKGKGIRFKGEVVRRKQGKTGGKGAKKK